MLSFIAPRNPRSATVSQGHPTFFSQAAAVLAPLALAGSLLLNPTVSQAHITPAQLALHNARLAKRQAHGHDWIALSKSAAPALKGSAAKAWALHNARLAKLQALHRAHLALTTVKVSVLQQQALHQAKMAKTQAKNHALVAAHNLRLAKVLAAHQAQMAAHQAKLLARQQKAKARLAKLQAKATQKNAKLHMQHVALTSGNVVEAAYAFRGSRYVMGGTSRSGFDCSGFVRYILSNAGGVDVPRTATEQFYHGAPIAPDAMQPGDLVFFKNTYKRGISHVGIYAGGGKFIHAANAHKGVRMDNLSDRYYVAHFAGARRVLPAQMRAAAGLGL